MKWRALILAGSLLPLSVVAASGLDPSSSSSNQTYLVQSGDTLRSISQRKYGNPGYAALIAIQNKIMDESKLRPRQEIRTLDLKILLTEEKLVPILQPEIDAMLNARTLFAGVEGRLRELRQGRKEGRADVPPDVQAALRAALQSVDAAIAGLKQKKEGAGAVPQKMIGQLEGVSQNLMHLAAGSYDGYGYDLDMVHQRLALAMLNGIRWARNGYK